MKSSTSGVHLIDYDSLICARAVMAGIRGLNTPHPCPVCLVTTDDLMKYAPVWEYRDGQKNHELIKTAKTSQSAMDRAKATEQLEDMDLRVIEVRPMLSMNIHMMAIDLFDRMPFPWWIAVICIGRSPLTDCIIIQVVLPKHAW